MKNKTKIYIFYFIMAAMFAAVVLVNPLDRGSPGYDVNSLDKLKKEFRKYPDIIIPEVPFISEEPNSASFAVYQVNRNIFKPRKILNGYGISLSHEHIPLDDFVFVDFRSSCNSYGRNIEPDGRFGPLYTNARYFGVDMVESFWEYDDDGDTGYDRREANGVPQDAYFCGFSYEFDYLNARYRIRTDMFRPGGAADDADDAANAGNAAAVEKGRAEMLNIIKSIIVQGEARAHRS